MLTQVAKPTFVWRQHKGKISIFFFLGTLRHRHLITFAPFSCCGPFDCLTGSRGLCEELRPSLPRSGGVAGVCWRSFGSFHSAQKQPPHCPSWQGAQPHTGMLYYIIIVNILQILHLYTDIPDYRCYQLIFCLFSNVINQWSLCKKATLYFTKNEEDVLKLLVLSGQHSLAFLHCTELYFYFIGILSFYAYVTGILIQVYCERLQRCIDILQLLKFTQVGLYYGYRLTQ